VPYAFIQDVPADEEIYRQIRELLPAETPAGLITHLAVRRTGGLRYIDVWETEADWQRFRLDQVEPAVEKVLARFGIPHDHDAVAIDELDVVDLWRA
jgi:hypothetical protein